jgi:hypothetical protein
MATWPLIRVISSASGVATKLGAPLRLQSNIQFLSVFLTETKNNFYCAYFTLKYRFLIRSALLRILRSTALFFCNFNIFLVWIIFLEKYVFYSFFNTIQANIDFFNAWLKEINFRSSAGMKNE